MQKIKIVFLYGFWHTLITSGISFRILGLFPYPSASHYVMFEALMKELAERGHQVDVLNHFPQKEPITRFNDLSMRGALPIMRNNVSVTIIENGFRQRLSLMRYIFQRTGIDFCKVALDLDIVRKLRDTKTKYDLIITEIFGNDCMLGFGYHFGVPVVSMISSTDLPWGTVRIGNPKSASYTPFYFSLHARQKDLLQKLDQTCTTLLIKFWHLYMQYKTTLIARKFFGDLPDLRTLASNTSLILVNSHSSLNTAGPNVPNVIEVGGLHIKPKKSLPQDLADMVNTTSPQYKGFVYFSMGSMVLTETLPKEKLLALFEAFSELPYQILWKASVEKIPADISIPPNIKFQSWLPQLDILCHSNVKLFVTHGGLMGTQEAVYCGVPCLGIPLFADQQLNINALVDNGMALSMDYDSINKQDLLILANELLNNPSYKSNAETASNRFKDRPMSPLDTAVYWVEYVIRHKGARHLRSPAADLTWYEYHLLDVGAILILGTLIVLYLIVKTISTIIKILRRIVKSKKRKSD